MVFGTPASVAAPAPKPNQTMVFGTPAVAAPRPAAGPQRPVFGTPAAQPRTPAAEPDPAGVSTLPGEETLVPGSPFNPAQPKNQTMMFGRAAVKPPGPRVTPVSVERAGYAAGDEGKPQPERTTRAHLEGGGEVPGDVPSLPLRDRTQRYAMPDASVPPAVEPRDRTVLHAMDRQETTSPGVPMPTAPAEPAVRTRPSSDHPPVNQTLMFGARGVGTQAGDGSSVVPEGDMVTPRPQPAFQFEEPPVGTTMPDLSPLNQEPLAQRIELPPEPDFASATPLPTADPTADDAAVAAMRAATNRRTTIAVLVFLAIALALGLALVWVLFGAKLLSKDGAEIRRRTQDALTELRRDDNRAHQSAVTQLEALVAGYPKAVEPRAALVIAAACAADDSAAEAVRLQKALLQGGRAAGQPVDRSEADAARSAAEAKRAALGVALAQLESAAKASPELEAREAVMLVRARAFNAAVLGLPTAVELAEELHQKSAGVADSWRDLALPEYAVNGGSSYDEALRQLKELQARDTTFLRAYAVAARLQLITRDAQGASTSLETLLALNPAHDTGKALQAWVRAHQSND
jgi:hypothetical protein